MRPVLEAEMFGQPHLFIKRKNFLGHVRMHVEERPYPPQELSRLDEGGMNLLSRKFRDRRFANGRRLITAHADPLQHMESRIPLDFS